MKTIKTDQQAVIDRTQRWIRAMVIGLNLCPFAQRVVQEDRIRYVVTEAEDEAKGFELGAVDYIHKPFNPTVVRARVHTHLLLRDTLVLVRGGLRSTKELLRVDFTRLVRAFDLGQFVLELR